MKKQYLKQNKEQGFTLAVVLFITIGFAVLLAFLSESDRSSIEQNRLTSVAWQVKQIGKAARLMVRNNSLTNATDNNNDGILDNTYAKANLDPALGGASIEIDVLDLINAGYLPNTFLNVDATGTDLTDRTIFNQPIRIFAANSPISADSNLGTTVATAYVIMEDSAEIDAADTIAISNALQAQDVPLAAPLYSGGTNISENCGSGPAISAWDTGCMDSDSFDVLVGTAAGSGSFVEGSLVLPSWRTVEMDARALMRFPQPENPTANTMLTNLYLGRPVDTACVTDFDTFVAGGGTQMQINDDDGSGGITKIDTGLCNVLSDVIASQTDNRVDILNLASMDANRVILADQRDKGVFPNTIQDVQVILDGSVSGVTTTGEIVNALQDTLDIDVDGNTLDPDDVFATGGDVTITGNTQFFDDPDYTYAATIEEVYFDGNATIQGNLAANSASGTSEIDIAGSVLADYSIASVPQNSEIEVITNTLRANNAVVNVGIEEGRVVNGLALTADSARASDQATVNLDSISFPNGIDVKSSILDAAATDNIGLTVRNFNPNGNDINADSAVVSQAVKSGRVVVADQGSGLPVLANVSGTDYHSVVGNFVNSTGEIMTLDDVTLDESMNVEGDSRFIGTTNINNCSGSPNGMTGPTAECPVVETLGPLF